MLAKRTKTPWPSVSPHLWERADNLEGSNDMIEGTTLPVAAIAKH